jgi:hypothetical protein
MVEEHRAIDRIMHVMKPLSTLYYPNIQHPLAPAGTDGGTGTYRSYRPYGTMFSTWSSCVIIPLALIISSPP